MQLFLMISHVDFEICDEGPIKLHLFLTVKNEQK